MVRRIREQREAIAFGCGVFLGSAVAHISTYWIALGVGLSVGVAFGVLGAVADRYLAK